MALVLFVMLYCNCNKQAKKCRTMISLLCDKQDQRRNSSESCFLVDPECLEAPAHTWAALQKVSFSGHYVRNDITKATMIGWIGAARCANWPGTSEDEPDARQHLKPRKRSESEFYKYRKIFSAQVSGLNKFVTWWREKKDKWRSFPSSFFSVFIVKKKKKEFQKR